MEPIGLLAIMDLLDYSLGDDGHSTRTSIEQLKVEEKITEVIATEKSRQRAQRLSTNSLAQEKEQD